MMSIPLTATAAAAAAVAAVTAAGPTQLLSHDIKAGTPQAYEHWSTHTQAAGCTMVQANGTATGSTSNMNKGVV